MQKPIVDRLGEAYDNPAKVSSNASPHRPLQPQTHPPTYLNQIKCKRERNLPKSVPSLLADFTIICSLVLQTELALQLCWAIGEHGGGGPSHKDEARELFESLELLLYENLSSRYNITVL